jgi:adenosylmethionine-8-amino-7-oxononanoate aminotransferase
VSQVGHGRTEIAEAGARQAAELAYFPLWSCAHPKAIDEMEQILRAVLTEAWARIYPPGGPRGAPG